MTNKTELSVDDVDPLRHLTSQTARPSGLSVALNAHHANGGDIQPQTLSKAAKLETSLHEVIHALTHHEHLAMGADDIWRALNVQHSQRDINPE